MLVNTIKYEGSGLHIRITIITFENIHLNCRKHDLPMAADSDSKVLLFTDDTSIIITSSNQEGHQIALNKTLSDINSWFKANSLSPNLNKTYYLQF